MTRDFAPIWEVSATVDGFAKLEEVPLGYWPVTIVQDVQDAAGVHMDKNGQPFSLVEFGDSWSLTASHEVLEMLADPFGNRLITGRSPKQQWRGTRAWWVTHAPSLPSSFDLKASTNLVCALAMSSDITSRFFLRSGVHSVLTR